MNADAVQYLAIREQQPETEPRTAIFGRGNVINARLVFGHRSSIRAVSNMVWHLRFELGYRLELGQLTAQDKADFMRDIRRGTRLLRVLEQRHIRNTRPAAPDFSPGGAA